MISNLGFYTQYNYQSSRKAERNIVRCVKVSGQLSSTYSFVRNLLKLVFHQNELVKEEEARDPETGDPTQKRTKRLPKMIVNEGSREQSVSRVARECRAPGVSDLSQKNNIKITDYPMCECTEEIYTSVRVWG